MNKKIFLLRSILMTILFCMMVLSLRAQDTAGHQKPSANSSVAGLPHEKDTFRKKSETAREVLKQKESKNSFQEHDTGKVTRKKIKPLAKDTTRKALQPAMFPAAPSDTGAGNKIVVTKPAAPSFALPSFASQSFSRYHDFINYLLDHNAVFKNTSRNQPDEIIPFVGNKNDTQIKTNLFYIISGLIFLLAVLRLSFSKYSTDLFRAFYNPTLSKRQLREQLSQAALPALMFNIFFTISAGLYVYLILQHFHYITVNDPLILIPVFILLMIIIYLFKYVFIRFSGWLFNSGDIASGYIFTLYMVNKILGIGLLPFILMLAFCTPPLAEVALNISLIWIALLFIYRYIRIFGLARNKIIFNKFHFFIYLCAFEIAPVLVIGKLVLIWLNGA